MSKETVSQIGKAIEEARKAKELERLRKYQESSRKAAEKEALRERNKARLKATGVVDLFEELRDSGVLKFSRDERAKIVWEVNDTRLTIVISFDEKYVSQGEVENVSTWSELRATIPENRPLQINNHSIKPGETLENRVTEEILRIKGLKE